MAQNKDINSNGFEKYYHRAQKNITRNFPNNRDIRVDSTELALEGISTMVIDGGAPPKVFHTKTNSQPKMDLLELGFSGESLNSIVSPRQESSMNTLGNISIAQPKVYSSFINSNKRNRIGSSNLKFDVNFQRHIRVPN